MGLLYKHPKLYDYLVDKFFDFEDDPEVQNLLDKGVELENLSPGSVILDLACGTGITTMWMAEMRPDIEIIALDISAEMIAKAKIAIEAKQLQNIHLVTMTAFDLTPGKIQEITNSQRSVLDMVVCSHGYSAMDDPQPIFEHTLSLLKKGGYYVIMDEHYPKRNLLTILSQSLFDRWFLGANPFNKPWLLLEDELSHFVKYDKPLKNFGIIPINYYVARGVKL